MVSFSYEKQERDGAWDKPDKEGELLRPGYYHFFIFCFLF
jgi:hypothetical protein